MPERTSSTPVFAEQPELFLRDSRMMAAYAKATVAHVRKDSKGLV